MLVGPQNGNLSSWECYLTVGTVAVDVSEAEIWVRVALWTG
jgi:hypothetical protein